MSEKNKFLSLMLLLSIIVASLFSPLDVVLAKSSSNKIELEKSKYETYVGNKINIKVDKASKYTFSSSNKKVATVSSKGVVNPKKKGTVNIRVSLRRDSKNYVLCKVRIYEDRNIYKLQKYVGKWKVDSIKTGEENDVSLWYMYGTAFTHYGAELEIKANGKFSYYIGVGNGGSGNCKIKKANHIFYSIRTYEENTKQTGTIISKSRYLIMSDPNYPDFKVYWIRENDKESEP